MCLLLVIFLLQVKNLLKNLQAILFQHGIDFQTSLHAILILLSLSIFSYAHFSNQLLCIVMYSKSMASQACLLVSRTELDVTVYFIVICNTL
jgi:hypothetical protein